MKKPERHYKFSHEGFDYYFHKPVKNFSRNENNIFEAQFWDGSKTSVSEYWFHRISGPSVVDNRLNISYYYLNGNRLRFIRNDKEFKFALKLDTLKKFE